MLIGQIPQTAGYEHRKIKLAAGARLPGEADSRKKGGVAEGITGTVAVTNVALAGKGWE